MENQASHKFYFSDAPQKETWDEEPSVPASFAWNISFDSRGIQIIKRGYIMPNELQPTSYEEKEKQLETELEGFEKWFGYSFDEFPSILIEEWVKEEVITLFSTEEKQTRQVIVCRLPEQGKILVKGFVCENLLPPEIIRASLERLRESMKRALYKIFPEQTSKPFEEKETPQSFTVSSDRVFVDRRFNSSISFWGENGKVGELYFEDPMRFEGNVEESAKVFFDYFVSQFKLERTDA